MLFCSQAYLVFFAIVFVVYWALPWHKARIYLLLGASFYFYACWNHWLALLIGVCTAVDYLLARGMDAYAGAVRKRLLILSIVSNLGLLCYFKYANFFLDSLQETLARMGMEASFPLLQVILPIGISFYTFEAINYMVDVYRGHIRAEKDIAHFMLFITFFPHLVAGPIVRARDFLPQIKRPKRWDWLRIQLGAQLFLLGMFKKLVIADRLAALADPVFANPSSYQSSAAWLAVFAWILQAYCDFSGYTDMALGSAHLLGYKLAKNFDMPYLARNIADFWNRWHISLSSWLRDYLFIPLGGSRGGAWRTCRNLIITMTLCGLWHGASWTYVLFGFIQAIMLIVHRSFRISVQHWPALNKALLAPLGAVCCILFTFVIYSLSTVVFRATSIPLAGDMYARLFTACEGRSLGVNGSNILLNYVVIFGGYFLYRGLRLERLYWRLPAPVVGVGYSLALSLILVLTPASGQPFIYFQF